MARFSSEEFDELAAEAIDDLPAEFRRALKNISVVVERGRRPWKGGVLLGLYEGVPLKKRGTEYGGVLPDKITLFRDAIEEYCARDRGRIVEQVRKTLLHEVGHYLGLSERRLRELGCG